MIKIAKRRANMRTTPTILSITIIVMLIAATADSPAEAAIVKGPLVFTDHAFADTATMIVGSITTFDGGATSVQEAVCGSNLATAFGTGDFFQGETVQISFLDNAIYNGSGADLAVFEKHSADGFDVAVALPEGGFSAFLHFEPVYQGFNEGGNQNAALINLDDFGLAPDTIVSSILIREDDYDSAELSGVGALNSIPESATVALLGLGGLALLRKRNPYKSTVFSGKRRG